MMFYFSDRSEKNLEGVHPDLVRVMRHALLIAPWDFCITEGLRSEERQRELFETGATKTLNSRHLTGDAVDIAAMPDGVVSWEFHYYIDLSHCIKEVARINKIPIEWGGDWKDFKDGVHFQLPHKEYP